MKDDWMTVFYDRMTLPSDFKTFVNNYPMTYEESKQKVVTKKAWNTLCKWVAELIIVDGFQIDIGYSKRDKSEIRIVVQKIDKDGFGNGENAQVYRLSEDDIGVAVLPKDISTILRKVWNQKELEKSLYDAQYFINRYTYVMGVDPYKK